MSSLISVKLDEEYHHKNFLKRELLLAQKNLKNYEGLLKEITSETNRKFYDVTSDRDQG